MSLKEGYSYEEAQDRLSELLADALNGLDPARVEGVAEHLMAMSDFTAQKLGLFLHNLMDLSHEMHQVRGTDQPTIWTPNNGH